MLSNTVFTLYILRIKYSALYGVWYRIYVLGFNPCVNLCYHASLTKTTLLNLFHWKFMSKNIFYISINHFLKIWHFYILKYSMKHYLLPEFRRYSCGQPGYQFHSFQPFVPAGSTAARRHRKPHVFVAWKTNGKSKIVSFTNTPLKLPKDPPEGAEATASTRGLGSVLSVRFCCMKAEGGWKLCVSKDVEWAVKCSIRGLDFNFVLCVFWVETVRKNPLNPLRVLIRFENCVCIYEKSENWEFWVANKFRIMCSEKMYWVLCYKIFSNRVIEIYCMSFRDIIPKNTRIILEGYILRRSNIFFHVTFVYMFSYLPSGDFFYAKQLDRTIRVVIEINNARVLGNNIHIFFLTSNILSV